MTLNTQFLTIVSMIFGGFYLGLAYDTYRRLMQRWQNRTFLMYMLEMAFWLSQTAGLFYILFQMNNGELRIYVFLACALGFAMYQALLAPLYQQILESVITITVRLLHRLWKIFHILFFRPLNLVLRFVFYCVQLLGQVLLIGLKVVFTPVLLFGKLFNQLIPKKIKKSFDKETHLYSIMKDTCNKIGKVFSLFKRR